jgi:hypothetical protein
MYYTFTDDKAEWSFTEKRYAEEALAKANAERPWWKPQLKLKTVPGEFPGGKPT